MKKTILFRFMCWYDAFWRRRNNVEKFDELLSFSFEEFSGERKKVSDGIWIEPGDKLAIMHFNRECFTHFSSNTHCYTNALLFRRLFLSSFRKLAKQINDNENFLHVKAIHGVSWIPPHGHRVGFLVERLPDSAINRARKFYFSILLKTLFPHVIRPEQSRIQPHAYWLTRQNLLKYFS